MFYIELVKPGNYLVQRVKLETKNANMLGEHNYFYVCFSLDILLTDFYIIVNGIKKLLGSGIIYWNS